jgi:SPP1 family predicted phage head-tail adaptor
VRAGPLRRRVQYQTSAPAADAYGQEQPAWTTVGTYFAAIRSPTGREATNALQQKAVGTHVVTVRWQGSTPSPAGRLLYAEGSLPVRVFNISAVLNVDERNRQVDFLVEELVGPVELP